MKHAFSEEELTQAAQLVRQSMLDSLEAATEEPHIFSEEFEAGILRLQAVQRKKARCRAIRTRLIAALVTIILSISLFLSTQTEVRASVVAWIKQILEGKTQFWFQEETQPRSAFPEVQFGWLPEGLECTLVEITDIGCSYVFTNPMDSTESFTLGVTYMADDISLIIDYCYSEHTVSSVWVNGLPGELYTSYAIGDTNNLIWFDDASSLYFDLNTSYDPDIIMHIAENVSLVIPTK